MPQETMTMKIEKSTKERLDRFKESESESYNFVINKALNIINICSKNPPLAYRILRDIERAKERKILIANSDKVSSRKRSFVTKPELNLLKRIKPAVAKA